MGNSNSGRLWGALLASALGGFLLYYSGRQGSDDALAFAAVVIGMLLFGATVWLLSRAHRAGTYTPSDDELSHREWRWFQFLRFGAVAAAVLLPIRLYVGYEWLEAGLEKVGSPAWTGARAGTAVQGFVRGALERSTGEHPAVQGWYAWFLREAVLPNAGVFGWMVAWGEVLVGIALLAGFLTGVSAFFGGVMNANFLLAGTVSTNPILLALELVLIVGWRTAGWLGLDRWLLPKLTSLWDRRAGSVEASPGYTGDRARSAT